MRIFAMYIIGHPLIPWHPCAIFKYISAIVYPKVPRKSYTKTVKDIPNRFLKEGLNIPHGYGYGGGFALIVVLFILLIIVGAGGFVGGHGVV